MFHISRVQDTARSFGSSFFYDVNTSNYRTLASDKATLLIFFIYFIKLYLILQYFIKDGLLFSVLINNNMMWSFTRSFLCLLCGEDLRLFIALIHFVVFPSGRRRKEMLFRGIIFSFHLSLCFTFTKETLPWLFFLYFLFASLAQSEIRTGYYF